MGKQRLSAIGYGVSAAVYGVILALGKSPSLNDDVMGYVIFYFYLLMPTMCFIIALLLSMQGAPLRLLYPVAFGFAGWMMPYFIFGYTEAFALLFAAVPATVGTLAGLAVWAVRRRLQRPSDG